MHVAITGASSGIGEALVEAFAARGADITMVARSQDKMETIAARVSAKTQIIPRDLSTLEGACDWLQEAEAAFGPIDVLVNNAGVQIVAPLTHSDPDQGARLLTLNLTVPLQLMRALLPQMLERDSGAFINIASVAGIAPPPGMFYYNAAKAGLGAASESLRAELRDSRVRVLTVYPGPIDTPMAHSAYDAYQGTAPKTMTWLTEGTADQLAQRILHALDHNKARLIYPRFYTLTRHLPGLTRWLLNRFAPIPPAD